MNDPIKQNITRNILLISLALFSLLLAWHLMGGLAWDLKIPLVYGGDGLSHSWMVKRVIDGAWYFNNSANGFPFGSDFRDYPGSDAGNFLVLKLIGMVTGNYAVTLNLYFLISFPVTALVSFYILKKFRISDTFSWVGAVIFTFLPFHFFRLPHLFYTWYFVVPIYIWLSYKIYVNQPLFFELSATWKSRILTAFILLMLSCYGVYFAVFGILIFFISGVVSAFQKKAKENLFSALFAILIVCIGVGANLTPNVLYKIEHGANLQALERHPSNSEIYALKIAQLVLPHSEHRLKKFAKITDFYNKTFPLVNENHFATLGIIGSVGFLILIAVLFFKRGSDHDDDIIYWLALITIFMILFATVGGFSSLFALFISHTLHGWNRISIFIGFTAIATVMLLLDHFFQKRGYRHLFRIIAAVMLVLFGLWDQTFVYCVQCAEKIKQEFTSDDQFIKGIEKILPAGAAVYQLPYRNFPESDFVDGYEPIRAYLHSSQLKWSYGGMKWRPGDLFFRALAKQPLAKQITIIKRIGFSGIYIDRNLYEDHAVAIERELTDLTGKGPDLISPDHRLSFFKLSSAAHPITPLPTTLDITQIIERAGFSVNHLGGAYETTLQQGIDFKREGSPSFIADAEGISAWEPWGRWSDTRLSPTIKFIFKQPLPSKFILVLKVVGFGKNIGNPAQVRIGNQVHSFVPSTAMQEFRMPFTLDESEKIIEIIPFKPQSVAGRKIAIGFEKLSIQSNGEK